MIVNYNVMPSPMAMAREVGEEGEGKRCGWWCRNWKKVVVAVVTVVAGPVTGGIVASAIATLEELNVFGRGTLDSYLELNIDDKEVSDEEAAKIKSYLDTYFFPVYENVLRNLDKIATSSDISFQLIIINDVLKTMAVYKQYVATVNDQGLTPDGFALRRDFITGEFETLENYIATILSNANVKVEQYTVKIEDYNKYVPLKLQNQAVGTVNALVYRAVSSGSINVATDIPVEGDYILTANNPDPKTAVPDTTTNPTTTQTKNSSLNWFLIALATFGFYKVATKEKSKK